MAGPANNPLDSPTPEFTVERLLTTDLVSVLQVNCRGTCRHRSAEECASHTHFVFPFRGVYLRHVGSDQAVADANHVLFFNAEQGYQVSHPVSGGDTSLVVSLASPCWPSSRRNILVTGSPLTFNQQYLRIDARTQALAMLLNHSLRNGSIESLEAEGLSLTLISRAIGPRTARATGATYSRRRLVDRVKVLLASDLSRRWTLAGIASGNPRLAGVSDAGIPAGGRNAAVSLSPAVAPGARARPGRRAREISPGWRRIWASPATAISPPPSGRPTAARLRNSLKISTAAVSAEWSAVHARIAGVARGNAMTKKTCACCDYPLDPKSTIEVKIGGKSVEVCCEECATKLREASAKQKKK